MVDFPTLNQHCASDYMHSAGDWSLFSTTWAKAFLTLLKREIHLVVVAVIAVTLVLVNGDSVGVLHLLVYDSFFPAL